MKKSLLPLAFATLIAACKPDKEIVPNTPQQDTDDEVPAWVDTSADERAGRFDYHIDNYRGDTIAAYTDAYHALMGKAWEKLPIAESPPQISEGETLQVSTLPAPDSIAHPGAATIVSEAMPEPTVDSTIAMFTESELENPLSINAPLDTLVLEQGGSNITSEDTLSITSPDMVAWEKDTGDVTLNEPVSVSQEKPVRPASHNKQQPKDDSNDRYARMLVSAGYNTSGPFAGQYFAQVAGNKDVTVVLKATETAVGGGLRVNTDHFRATGMVGMNGDKGNFAELDFTAPYAGNFEVVYQQQSGPDKLTVSKPLGIGLPNKTDNNFFRNSHTQCRMDHGQ